MKTLTSYNETEWDDAEGKTWWGKTLKDAQGDNEALGICNMAAVRT